MKGTNRKSETLTGQALKDSELRYRRLFEAAQDGILILDAETGMIEDVNPYLIKMLGYSRDEFIKKKLWEVGAFEDIEASQDAFEALQKKEYIRYEDLPLKTKDGRLIQVEFVSNVYSVGGKKVIQCNIREITEHTRIIAALQENEKTYHDLINQSPDGFFVIESSGKILTVNDAICNALEFSQEELLSMNIWDIIPEQYLDQYRKRLKNILSGKSLSEEAEYTVQGKDGKAHYVEILSAPHYSGKDIVGFQGIARDITARKQAEEQLRYQATLLANVNDAIVATDAQFRLTTWNAGAEALYGWKAEEVLGKNGIEIVRTEWPSKDADEMRRMITEAGLWSGEATQARKDGARIPVDVSSIVLHDENGKVSGYVSINRDITKRKQAEERLEEERSLLRTLIDNLPDRVYVKDAQGRKILSNMADWQASGGKTMEDVIGKTDFDTYPPELAEKFWAIDKTVIDSGISIINREEPGLDSQGNPVWVLSSKVPLHDHQGKISGLVGIGRDITEHKRIEQELVDLAKFPSENPNPVLRLSRDGILLYANASSDALLGMWGCALGDSAPQFWCDLVAQALASMKIKTVEVECDGKIYSMIVNPVAEQGYANIYGNDITELKQAEDALQESLMMIEGIIDTIPVSVFWKDKNLVYLGCNSLFAHDKGFTDPEDVIGKDDYQMAPPDLAELYRDDDRQVIENGRSKLFIEEPQTTPEGKTITLLTSKVLLRSSKGEIIGVLGTYMDITERKQAEEALRGSEAKYKALFESVSDAIFIYDPDSFEILDANEATSKLYGYDKDELIGMSCLKFSAEVDKTKNLAVQIIKDGQANVPYRHHKKKNGSDLFVNLTGYHVMVNGQDTTFAVCRDITEYMQTQAAQQESERRFRDMQENIDMIAVMLDRDGRITFCNDYLLNLTGHSRASVLGQDWFELFVPPELDIKDDFLAGIQQRTVIAPHYENEILTSSGERRLVSWNNTILKDSNGQVIGTNSIGEDITERRRTEKALHESDKRFRALIENSTDAITLLDAKGIAIYDSPASPGMLGYGPTDWIGKDVFALMHPDDLPEIRNLFENLTNTPNERVNSTFRVRHKSGAWLWIEMVATNLLAEPGVEAIVLNYRDISERKQAEQKIKRRITELEALYQSGIAFNQTFDQKDIGEKLLEVLSTHLNWHHAAVRVRLTDSEDVELVAYMQPDEKRDGGLQMRSAVANVSDGLAGWVIQNEKPLRINNLKEDPRYVATFDGMNSGLYVPMRTYDQTIGCVSVESDQLNAFTKEDERLLITLAIQAAASMRNAELFEGMQKELTQRKLAEEKIKWQIKQLSTLSKIDQLILSSYNLRLSLSEIVVEATISLGVDAASILILNSSSQILEYGADHGFRTKVAREARVVLGESYAGRAALERQLVQIPNLRDEPDNLLLTTLLTGEDFVCYYSLPLIAKGQVNGVLEVFHRAVLEPDEEWFDFFYALARQTAIAIESISLFNDLQRSNSELNLAYETTLEGWSRALDLRDKETEGHTQRVTEMAVSLARDFGLSEAELVDVRRGGLLHDIGKMGVPDHILLKPGKLTEEEWILMRMHPVYAYDLLSHITYLRGALNIPHYHHEKWDGSGYPDGLKGAQIPLVARIFAVVDVWDALISERPYRPAWTKEKAREYILSSSGTHFDPQVVEIFLKNIK